MAENPRRAEEATPQETPTPNSDDLGRFKSLEAKQRSLRNLKAPRRPGDPPLNPNNLGGRLRSDGPATKTLRRLLRSKFPNDPKSRTFLDLIVESVCKQAIKGNVFAQQLVFDRIDGRLGLPVEQDLPCQITVVVNRNQERYPEMKRAKETTLLEGYNGEERGND